MSNMIEDISRVLLRHYQRSMRKITRVLVHPVDAAEIAIDLGRGAGSAAAGFAFASPYGWVTIAPDPDCPRGTFHIPWSELKHGPHGRGGPGQCDPDCLKCKAEARITAQGEPCWGCARDVPSGALDVTMRCDACRAKSGLPPRATPAGRMDAVIEIDPLDVEYDGVTLRQLLEIQQNENRALGGLAMARPFTPDQRAAVSAHWSAELRAKVAASKAADAERERRSVLVDLDEP